MSVDGSRQSSSSLITVSGALHLTLLEFVDHRAHSMRALFISVTSCWPRRRQLVVLTLVPLATAAFARHGSVCGEHGLQTIFSSRSVSSALYCKNLSEERIDDSTNNIELPLDFPRRNDVLVALEAVRKACQVTQDLQPDMEAWTVTPASSSSSSSSSTLGMIQKQDLSPVTVADYAVQAVVLQHLQQASSVSKKSVGFIAEEDSSSLLTDDNLCQQVMQASEILDRQALLDAIDLGKSYTRRTNDDGNDDSHADKIARPKRVWCLDPIDGTRGFLRGKKSGGQFCVALALLEDGEPTIGILGCPNLPTDVDDDKFAWQIDECDTGICATRGCIFVASRGGGCYQLPLIDIGQEGVRLHATPSDGSARSLPQARFCIGVEKFSDALGQCAGMAQYIHGSDALGVDGEIINAWRIDSQAKHGVLARGGAEFYVRLPKPGYVEWIWDHAAGNVVIEEAGGEMTDTNGEPIDFSLGAKLSSDVRGILMSNGGDFHKALVAAFSAQETKR